MILALLVVAGGCASAPVARDIQRVAVVEGADFNVTWDAVIDVFGERTWTIDNMERASGLITTDWMVTGSASEDYMDCGSAGAFGSHRDHAVRFNVVVREGDVGAQVTVNSAMRAIRWDDINGVARETTACVSLGTLEREVHEAVTRRALGMSR